MKNVSTLKSSKTDSPKTPGGISRSLLTPCRRVGLSRNFRKSGASPFQSPLSSKAEVKPEKVESRKRKESLEETLQTPENADEYGTTPSIQTPSRKVELPRRKKSKTLLASINKGSEESGPSPEEVPLASSVPCKSTEADKIHDESNKDMSSISIDLENIRKLHNANSKQVVTPLRLKSRTKIKKDITPFNTISKQSTNDLEKEKSAINTISVTESNEQEQPKKNSPNNLTKECIVVIQKKIFKKELKDKQKSPNSKEKHRASSPKTKEIVSQAVFDSDSDDVPLNCLDKDTDTKLTALNAIDEDDPDFAASKTKLSKPVKTKSKMKSPATNIKSSSKVVEVEIHKPPDSQDSDDDEDFYEKRRTILIKKSYDKVTKPHKAKSTGSITQKDIDDLKARIETKKKMLLARAMTEDTKELRDLIKKWQKGCQDALMELMDLMKSKFPDKQNMDYSEILQTLKIPTSLVGYDSDNDCFLTPDDESIILAKV